MFTFSGFCEFVCRDENCKIVELHGPHRVRVKKEPKDVTREPPQALDDVIERVVYRLGISCFRTILTEVEQDFGSLGPTHQSGLRRLHRRIAKLAETGRVCRLEVGERLFAYTPPDGRKRDVATCRKVIKEQLDFECYDRPSTRWSEAAS